MAQDEINILICGENSKTAKFIQDVNRDESYEFLHIEDVEEAIQQISPGRFQVLILELSHHSKANKLEGLRAIPIIRKIDPVLPIITIARDDSLEIERKVRMAGIFYYLIQPLDANEVKLSILNAIHKFEKHYNKIKKGKNYNN